MTDSSAAMPKDRDSDSAADAAIGRTIRRAREARGFDQAQLSEHLRAEGLNWSRATVSKVEGGNRPVRLAEAATVSVVLGVLVDELVPYRAVSIDHELKALTRHGEGLQREIEDWRSHWAALNEQAFIYELFDHLRKNPQVHAVVNGTCRDLAQTTHSRVRDMPAAMAFMAVLEELVPDFMDRDLPVLDSVGLPTVSAAFVSPMAEKAWDELCDVFTQTFPNVAFADEPLRRGERIEVTYPDGEPS